MRQSSLLLTLLTFVSVVTAYDLVGAWAERGGGQGTLTFQFARSVDSSGTLTAKLFVYDCFLAQFLFEAEEDSLSLNFQTSTLLTQDCPLTSLNNLRAVTQKITRFEIAFDQLRLMALSGESVFELVRQKYDYGKVLSGVWVMSTPSAAASSHLRINGSLLSLCGDQAQISYTLTTINGSYPRLAPVLAQTAPNCPDAAFLQSLQNAAFPRIAENLTQVILLDGRGNYLMTLDQITALPPTQPLITTKQSNQAPTQRPTPIQTPNPVQAPNPIYSAPLAPPTTTTTPSTPATTVSQQRQIEKGGAATQQSSSLRQQSSSSQFAVNQKKTAQNMQQAPGNSLQTAPTTTITTNSQITPIQQPQQPVSSFSWNFGQNYAFGGTFSSFSPFSFDPNIAPATQNPTPPVQDTPNTPVAASPTYDAVLPIQHQVTYEQYLAKMQQSAIGGYDAGGISGQDAGMNGQGLWMNGQEGMGVGDAGISSHGQISIHQATPSPLTQDTSSLQENVWQDSRKSIGMGVAELISTSMSGGLSGGRSLGDVVQGNKWLLVWLNGVSSLQQFSHVYIMFTSTRIVLYCPCNTYYATYQLQGNALKAEGWRGTNNRCDNNNDRRVTDYIFYANNLKLKGQNLAFYYNAQAQLAEFKPYY